MEYKNQVILIPKILTYLKAVLMMYLKKVEFYNGNYYTINPKFCSYKANSLRCIKV
jgi:hypothetical protein